MELRYTFDTRRYYLGTPCPNDHFWPGTELSLRKLYFSPQGVRVNHCVGCTGRKLSDWKISFIDHKAMGIPNGWKLGKLCKAEHRWNGLPLTLRQVGRKCAECEKERQRNKPQRMKSWRKKNKEKVIEYSHQAYAKLRADPEAWAAFLEKKKLARRKVRQHLQSQGLTTRGTQPSRPDPEVSALRAAIRSAGRLSSVAQLVAAAQHEYWKEHPEAYREYTKQRSAERHRWRHMTDESYRFYHRQKSKRRKAQMRDSVAIQLKGRQVRERFRQFENRCAYCSCTGDLHIEHVVPISKGGPHALGNIIPACKDCNFSKAAHEVESWYRSQPFFSELRWRKICRVLGWGRSSVGQLALL